jgi:hypothetical protein
VLNGISRDGARIGVDELAGWVNKAKSDKDEFIREMGGKLESYIRGFAREIISKDEFEDLVRGLVDLRKIKGAQIGVETKARAEKTANKFRELALDALLKMIEA